MHIVTDLAEARVFPTHRLLVDEVVSLQRAKLVDAYSVHGVAGGVVAGVRDPKSKAWGFLAEPGATTPITPEADDRRDKLPHFALRPSNNGFKTARRRVLIGAV
jgi:hypothetical protein